MSKKLDIILGDLLEQEVDAIVNPSNATLLEGGEIDSAIRLIGGEELKKACKSLHGCPVGEAKSTSAYNMKADHIIHTSSPIWRGGFFGEDKLLESSYKNSLKKAIELNIKTIAFPSLSTGSHNFPLEKAAAVAIRTICDFLDENEEVFERVYLVCYDRTLYESYKRAYFSYMNKAG